MIDLYTWKTPNGHKVSIMLEEIGLPYKVHTINISKQEQFTPTFLKINPNNKIPAIVDHEDGKPFALFESGAILIYLAEKTGKLLSSDKHKRALTLQWLMFQMGSIGPMLGQVHHFLHYAPEKVPYGIERYTKEAKRLYGVLDKHLSEHKFLADEYSIADIATFPWVAMHEHQQMDISQFNNIKRWLDEIAGRPAVQRGKQIPS